MTRRVRFGARAQRDIEGIAAWYGAQSAGLDVEFRLELDSVLQGVTDAPEAFTKIGKRTRRARLARFPYHVFFEVTLTHVHVSGVFHMHRRPWSWGDRVRESTTSPLSSGS